VSTASLGELAVRFGCTLKGDPDLRVAHVATLERADPQSLTFLANPRYRRYLLQTKAGAVVLDAKSAADCPVAALIAKNPYAVYARIASHLHPAPAVVPGRHPSAVVDPSAVIDPTAAIGPCAVIGVRAQIGARCVIGPGCVLMDDVTIGADTQLAANITLCSSVAVGERCLVHPGVTIGADGFGFAPDTGELVKVPQIGGVRIGNDVEIGANTTIDRGTIEDTVLEAGVKLDNQIQIGHNVHIGAHTVIAGCTGISGSTTIGARCMIAGQVGIAGHLSICDDVVVTGRSFVNSSIGKPGYYSGGLPFDEAVRFRKNAARFHRLDELARQVRRLAGEAPESAKAAEEAPDEHQDK
jgi:UDP-3-O-[3-hydroxymyristoyl] glucosamine N-acyltransferase